MAENVLRGGPEGPDPLTGTTGRGGFCDGTVFHRRVPGFVVRGGDRLGTGHGGAGYRIPERSAPTWASSSPSRSPWRTSAGTAPARSSSSRSHRRPG
ncbi:peptidylprolyl isomerase [Streptomyces anthocyanicus]|uniref:peptidylprolyl isomerase n=1 Tax=Streptomyces anthocyanicus TaxID=68174 RepID=UPI003662AAA2